MRSSHVFLAICLATLQACSDPDKGPGNGEENPKQEPNSVAQPATEPQPELTELQKTLNRHERAMDEQLSSDSEIMDGMDEIVDAAKNRAHLTEEERGKTLEKFVDRYISNMRKFIREQTIYENWFSKMIDVFEKELLGIPYDSMKILTIMETTLDLKDLPQGETQFERLTRIDFAQLRLLQSTLEEKRKSLTLEERAHLCVVRTRRPDGSFVRYHTLFKTVIGTKYSITGEALAGLGMQMGPEKVLQNGALEFSAQAEDVLKSAHFPEKRAVLISHNPKIDPEDDSHLIYGDWREAEIYISNADDLSSYPYFGLELSPATILEQKEDALILEVNLAYHSKDGSEEKAGIAEVTVSTLEGDFEILRINVKKLDF